MCKVRLSVKAIIVEDGRLLVLKNRDQDGEWYMLPGGGQEAGESVPAALRRECLEEIGSDVTVGRLRFVRDYIGKNHEFAAEDGDMHQVELMFECHLHTRPRLGSAPDAMQTGIAWLELTNLGDYRLYPCVLGHHLSPEVPAGEAIYLGDVN
jgi:8-oxo-dGTP diphosphatase